MTNRTIPVVKITADIADGVIPLNQPVELLLKEIRKTAEGGQ